MSGSGVVLRLRPSLQSRLLFRRGDPTPDSNRITGSEGFDLAAQLRARDPRALETLYDRFARRAFGLAYRVLGDGAAAEDAVQEAFLTLWNQSDRVDSRRGQVESLLMTIVHRRAVDIVRRRRGQPAYSTPLDFDMVDDRAADIVDMVADRINYETVRTALAGLAPEQRRTIELSYFEGMTHSEIAATTSTPLGTVKSRLRLGLERLRADLGIEKGK